MKVIDYDECINEHYIDEATKLKTEIATLLFIVENESRLDEMLLESEEKLEEALSDFLGKFGLKIHKGDGIIDYLMKFSKGAGKLLVSAIKGDKEQVKKIASSLDKGQVIDFLLKLDMATMHLVTGPIHFIDAVTGWDLSANLKKVAKEAGNVFDKIKTLFKDLKDTAKKVFTQNPEKIKAVEDLETQLVYA